MITTDSPAVNLDRLRELDRTDRYVSRRFPERDLRHLETARGITAPAAFRDVLHRIGTGAGPYHGILVLKPDRADLITDVAPDPGPAARWTRG
ncbi:hypothetical protein [Amycolatopsis sp. NPDC051903]|uniref:hypothetical protein n=1 Tax=Amycolatopsis sp. NPDC051903 TaxID=3363936 RepID=UPI003790AA5E